MLLCCTSINVASNYVRYMESPWPLLLCKAYVNSTSTHFAFPKRRIMSWVHFVTTENNYLINESRFSLQYGDIPITIHNLKRKWVLRSYKRGWWLLYNNFLYKNQTLRFILNQSYFLTSIRGRNIYSFKKIP